MVSASQNLDEAFAAVTVEPSAAQLSLSGHSTDLAGLEVRQLAAEGYFQAIAYWLNEPLVPQNVYAQVLADEAPGCIKVLVEFARAPQPKRLLKFVCDRIYKLNSNIIEGIHLVARVVGTGKTDWEQRVRIPTASARSQKQVPTAERSNATRSSATEMDVSAQSDYARSDSTRPDSTGPDSTGSNSTTVPTASAAQSGSFRQNTPRLVHESSRSKIAREVVRSQFKFFRAALITGSASAAFLFGGLTELILSERLATPVATESLPTAAPWYDEPAATEVAFRRGLQFDGKTVEAALETVAVVPHTDVTNPENPTVTLLFGGELGLDDFIFEEAESLDRLFSNVSIYQESDVSMVGIAEPLANASTSLQENFYRRTRPQAVRALKAGGIDIVNLASEGTLTYGSRGLSETLDTLDRQGIYRVGAGRNQQEAHRPEILEVKGQRIAYLGYNPEAVKAAKEDKAGVALTNSKERSHILEDIRAIRPQVDWVVVNYRWGDVLGQADDPDNSQPEAPEQNFAAIPEDWQRSLAHDAVDAGADLVVGYHPSQIQGAEIYRDRAIAYSLGDFVFGEAPMEDHDTAALRVSLRHQQMKVEFLPVSVRDSQIQMATGDRGAEILKGIRNASKTFEQPLRFPVVLKAPPVSVPAPSTPASSPPATAESSPSEFLPSEFPPSEFPPSGLPPSEPAPSTPALSEPASSESTSSVEPFVGEPSSTAPELSEPQRIEPAQPIPDRLVPDDIDPQAESEQTFDPPAPHPTLRESEALFPVEPDEKITDEKVTDQKTTDEEPENARIEPFIRPGTDRVRPL